jgi:hypothetical protein
VIAAHRRRHRRIFLLLALLLPLLVGLAVAARPEAPLNAELPVGAPAFPDDRR